MTLLWYRKLPHLSATTTTITQIRPTVSEFQNVDWQEILDGSTLDNTQTMISLLVKLISWWSIIFPIGLMGGLFEAASSWKECMHSVTNPWCMDDDEVHCQWLLHCSFSEIFKHIFCLGRKSSFSGRHAQVEHVPFSSSSGSSLGSLIRAGLSSLVWTGPRSLARAGLGPLIRADAQKSLSWHTPVVQNWDHQAEPMPMSSRPHYPQAVLQVRVHLTK